MPRSEAKWGIYLGEYFIQVDYDLSTRLVPSFGVLEGTTNFHVFELCYVCGNQGLLERSPFVIRASPK